MKNGKWTRIRLSAGSRGIRNYRNMSREGLLSALAERSSAESERNSISARIKKIRKDLNELNVNL